MSAERGKALILASPNKLKEGLSRNATSDAKKAYDPDYFTGELDPNYCTAFGLVEPCQQPPMHLGERQTMSDSDRRAMFNENVLNFGFVYMRFPESRVKAGALSLINTGKADEVMRALWRQLFLVGEAAYKARSLGATITDGVAYPDFPPSNGHATLPNGKFINFYSGPVQWVWKFTTILKRAAHVAFWICTTPGLPKIHSVDYELLGRSCLELAGDVSDMQASRRIGVDIQIIGSAARAPEELADATDGVGRGKMDWPECPKGIGEAKHQEMVSCALSFSLGQVIDRGKFVKATLDDSKKTKWLGALCEQGFFQHNGKRSRASAYTVIKLFRSKS